MIVVTCKIHTISEVHKNLGLFLISGSSVCKNEIETKNWINISYLLVFHVIWSEVLENLIFTYSTQVLRKWTFLHCQNTLQFHVICLTATVAIPYFFTPKTQYFPSPILPQKLGVTTCVQATISTMIKDDGKHGE